MDVFLTVLAMMSMVAAAGCALSSFQIRIPSRLDDDYTPYLRERAERRKLGYLIVAASALVLGAACVAVAAMLGD